MNECISPTGRPTRLGKFQKLIALLAALAAVSPVAARVDDVTINATTMADVACAGCPGGKGREMCYEVSLATNAENAYVEDFHVKVNSANAANFQCFTAAQLVGGRWVTRMWTNGHASQVEGGVNRHYASWYKGGASSYIDPGETWRFCVVYCGSTNSLDNTIEFIATFDGSSTPAVPGDDGNRANVPDIGTNDDPGWARTWTNATGAGTGFLLNVQFIEPGLDLFTTAGGGASYSDFARTPIPANFFGPGSEPFTNYVVFQGEPLPPLSGNTLFPVDTVVRRLGPASVPLGGSATVPIELVALSLVSVQPITITYSGGRSDTWDVRVYPSAVVPQQPGQMTIRSESNGFGGTFSSTLPVRPQFVFTRNRDGQTRTFDSGAVPSFPMWMLHAAKGRWTESRPLHVPAPVVQDGLQIPPPFAGPSLHGPLPGTSENFHPGLRYDACLGQPDLGLVRQTMARVQGTSAALGLLPAVPPGPDRDGDGIPDDADNCPDLPNPFQEDADDDGVGDLCDNCPSRYNPCQEDTDGQPGGDACGYQIRVPAGFSTLANNYASPAATLDELLPRMVDGTMLFRWRPATQTYEVNIFVGGRGWDPPSAPPLVPGEGAWISSPEDQVIVFAGIVPPPQPAPRPRAGFYLAGSPTPRPAEFEVLMGYPPVVGDRVYRYPEPQPAAPPPGAPGAETFEFTLDGWVPADPIVQPGKAVFVELAVSAPSNQPPVLAPLPARRVHAGTILSIQLAAIDPEGQPLTFALDAAPPGAVLDPALGLIILPTTLADLGIHPVAVRVTDAGTPPLSAAATFLVIVEPPPVITAIRLLDEAIELEWNSIPGQDYVVRSKSDLAAAEWDFRNAITATDSSHIWRDYFSASSPGLFFDVATFQEGICGCSTMTNRYVDPTLGRVKLTFGAGEAPDSVRVEIPLALVGTLLCSGGTGHCEGTLSVTVTGSWEVVTAAGVHRFDVDDTTRGTVGGSKPDDANWNKVQGTCELTNKYSIGAKYSENLDISGLTFPDRKALKAGTTYLRGTLDLAITSRCGRNLPVSTTARVVVDGRMDANTDADPANEIKGGFDDDASDYDGDNRNPDSDPFDPAR